MSVASRSRNRRGKRTKHRTYKPASRRRRHLVLLFVVPLLLVAMAPTIVAKTPLGQMLLARAAAGFDGTLTVGDMSLGWFSRPMVRNLELRDAGGELVLGAASITGGRSLVAMLSDRTNLGTVRIEAPRLDLVLRPGGSNLEDVLAPLLLGEDDDDTDESSASAVPAVAIELARGTAAIRDAQSANRWQLDSVDLRGQLAAGGQSLRAEAQGTLRDDAGAGSFAARWECSVPSADALLGYARGKLRLKAQRVPLALGGAVVQRFQSDTHLAGRADVELQYDWEFDRQNTPQATLAARVRGDALEIEAAPLGTDVLRLAHLDVPCHFVRRGNRLDVKQLGVDCDLGNVSYQGTIDMAAGLVESLTAEPYQLSGHVDLPRLARTLPATLRIREGVELAEGTVELRLESSPLQDGAAWNGYLSTGSVVAVRDGQQIRWDQPIRVELAGRKTADQLVLDRLHSTSGFFQLEGQGTLDEMSAAARFDLDELAEQLSQFVDLTEVQLAGRGQADLSWRRDTDGRFSSTADMELGGLQVTTPESRPWREERLQAHVQLAGFSEELRIERLDTATLQIHSGGDQLDVRLTRPVERPSSAGTWPVQLAVAGEIPTWLARLQPAIGALDGWELGGRGQIQMQATYSDKGIELASASADLHELHAWGHGWFIDEPALQLAAAGRIDPQSSALQLRDVTMRSSALAVDAPELHAAAADDGPLEAEGQLAYSADLARLQSWLHDRREPPAHTWQGRARGQLQMARADGVTRARLDTAIDNFELATAAGARWREPQLQLAARAQYDHDRDTVTCESVTLTAAALRGSLGGTISELTGQRSADLSGQLDYDLAKLQPLLDVYLGPKVRFAGRDAATFTVRGPLAAAETEIAENPRAHADTPPSLLGRLTAETAFAWQWGDVYGFGCGPGRLQLRLADGALQIAPLEVAVNGGMFRAAPTLLLSPGPAELVVAPGRMIEQVRITPAMCDQALKFIAPPLAGVADAQGRFSIDLEGCRLPVGDPSQGNLAGQFTVHSVDIGPGPFVREVAFLLSRPTSTVGLSRESVVRFRMVAGRVYHEGLELVFPDFTIRTHGSVGLDHSLSLLAEMPVPPKWIGNNPLGETLKGKVLRVPIGGTLEAPKLDRQTLERYNAEFVRETATDVFRNELRRGLDRLIGPPQ